MPIADEHHLTTLNAEQVAAFARDGYLGPFTAFSVEEMAALREELDREFFPTGRYMTKHLENPLIYRLATAPAIIDRVTDLFDGRCVLWQTNFFIKQPGAKEIPWHQDRNYWPIDPEINISAWLAIDAVDQENACVQLMPGSHTAAYEHTPPTGDTLEGFTGEVDTRQLTSAREVVDMVLAPGQFFLFTEKLLHHSEPNRSDRRRAGMVVRLTVPEVRIEPGHVPGVIRLRGDDPYGHNPVLSPPSPHPA